MKGSWEEGEYVGKEAECAAKYLVEKGEGSKEEGEKEGGSASNLVGLGYYSRGEVLRGGSGSRSIVKEGFLQVLLSCTSYWRGILCC